MVRMSVKDIWRAKNSGLKKGAQMYGLEVKDNPAKKTKKSNWEAKGVIRIRAHGPKKIRKFFCDKEVV